VGFQLALLDPLDGLHSLELQDPEQIRVGASYEAPLASLLPQFLDCELKVVFNEVVFRKFWDRSSPD